MKLHALLLLSSSLLVLPGIAFAQDAAPAEPSLQAVTTPLPAAASDEDEVGDEIVVIGQKPRGSVVGDIPPENTLGARCRSAGARHP